MICKMKAKMLMTIPQIYTMHGHLEFHFTTISASLETILVDRLYEGDHVGLSETTHS